MKLPRRRFLHLAAGAAALPAVSRTAWAQSYPTRPIRLWFLSPGRSIMRQSESRQAVLRLTRCRRVAHLTFELLKSLAETPDITHVPYRGARPALTE